MSPDKLSEKLFRVSAPSLEKVRWPDNTRDQCRETWSTQRLRCSACPFDRRGQSSSIIQSAKYPPAVNWPRNQPAGRITRPSPSASRVPSITGRDGSDNPVVSLLSVPELNRIFPVSSKYVRK
ncbi:hypothetical protein AW736_02390 [Termitidicoccus mucosus]|uniref:Uncharacterized protein n=1 Tax=Termitidicoccus mucosus TaxID=1184151 RepID=A0A178IQG2_9BACT|nr:hypothetical protein AW736_02390 [Opitutaceae bacterium TSB47]